MNAAGAEEQPVSISKYGLCVQDSVFSVSSSFSCPLYPPDLSSALQGTASSNVHARKNNRIVHEWLQFAFGCDFPPCKNKKLQYATSLFDLSSETFCFVLLFFSSYSHILMQSLVFHTTRLIRSIIQKCHSASHLFLKHYHTNTGGRTKGSEIYALHKFK